MSDTRGSEDCLYLNIWVPHLRTGTNVSDFKNITFQKCFIKTCFIKILTHQGSEMISTRFQVLTCSSVTGQDQAVSSFHQFSVQHAIVVDGNIFAQFLYLLQHRYIYIYIKISCWGVARLCTDDMMPFFLTIPLVNL